MSLNTRANFLMVVSIVFVIYSLLWALAPFSGINIPARLIIDFADWPMGNFDVPLDRNTMWLSAIGAGLLAAVSVFLGGIVVPAIKARDTRTTNVTILAMGLWYVIDSAGSFAAGVNSNVFFNSIFLALVLIPIVGIEKSDAN